MKRKYQNPDEEIKNRHIKQFAKKSGFWCMNCDSCIITPGERCPVCGKKDINKRNKK